MDSSINAYGDHLLITTGRHGADIAAQRLDDLDREALIWICSNHSPQPVTLDLGCGFGWQGLRFSLIGADSYLIDLLKEPPLISQIRMASGIDLTYISADLRGGITVLPDVSIDLAFSQRFIHYLHYNEAVQLISNIVARMRRGAIFFISASGINSELGNEYLSVSEPLDLRFGKLSAYMAEKHGIYEPVCLYSEEDLLRLMHSSGLLPVRVWRSSFGNIKGIFSKNV